MYMCSMQQQINLGSCLYVYLVYLYDSSIMWAINPF